MNDNYNYPMGADNDSAPWNARKTNSGMECMVSVTQILTKSDMMGISDDYVIDNGVDEDGYPDVELDKDNIDWNDEYVSQSMTIPELLKKLEEYVLGDLKCCSSNKKYMEYLNHILAACRGWKLEETIVEQE